MKGMNPMNEKLEPENEDQDPRSLFLYEKRLLDLESDFNRAYKQVVDLSEQLPPQTPDSGKDTLKMRLDTIKELIRLTCHKADLFMKLGPKYDVMKIHLEFMTILKERDPAMFREIVYEVDRRFRDMLHEDGTGLLGK
jgi:hypothetical protein